MKCHISTIPSRSNTVARLLRSLMLVDHITSVTAHVDHEYRGTVFNMKRAYADIVNSDKPGLMCHDDIVLRPNALSKWLPTLEKHLDDYPIVSLFTPPRAEFDRYQAAGHNAWVSREFLWPPLYLVRPDFAQQALSIERLLDPTKGPGRQGQYHDEQVASATLQHHGHQMCTLIGSFCNHDLDVKSSLGNGPKVGNNIRDTRIMVDKTSNFETLNPFVKTGAVIPYLDLESYRA